MTTCLRFRRALTACALLIPIVASAAVIDAQQRSATPSATSVAVTPPDYVIGPDDVLSILIWREKDMSLDVTVRPDGKISLPLINDIVAAGLTPEQLRKQVVEQAEKLVEDAQATVIVKTINSRRVFITGQVEKPGSYALTTRMTVLQLIAMAGGLKEFAKSNRIVTMRNDGGREERFIFDYNEVVEGKNLQQNLEMKPGDTVVVP